MASAPRRHTPPRRATPPPPSTLPTAGPRHAADTIASPSRRSSLSLEKSRHAYVPEPYETTRRRLMVARPVTVGQRRKASPEPRWSATHPLADSELAQLAHGLASRDEALRVAQERLEVASLGASQGTARLLGEIDALQSKLHEANAAAAALRSGLGAADADADAWRRALRASEADARDMARGMSGDVSRESAWEVAWDSAGDVESDRGAAAAGEGAPETRAQLRAALAAAEAARGAAARAERSGRAELASLRQACAVRGAWCAVRGAWCFACMCICMVHGHACALHMHMHVHTRTHAV